MPERTGSVYAAVAGLLLAASTGAFAQTTSAISGDVVKIGILNDQSGLYSDLAGAGSVEAAKMAIEDFGGSVLGKRIELVSADHQNKADIGSAKAREWFTQDGVDVIADFSNSAVGFAVQSLAKDLNKAVLIAASSSDFTGKACTDTSVQWVYTSQSNGYGLANILTESGFDSWYFITVDYAFGHAFANDMKKAVTERGGKVLGEVRHPLGTADMSSFLLQAQASKAKVVALASAGSDMANAVKQAAEFGLTGKQTFVTPAVFLTDIHSLGLANSKGLRFMTAFYWDRNDETREWSKRFFERRKAMPTMTQAGVYSAVRHYLKAVEAAQTDDARVVVAKMKQFPVQDIFSQNGKVREDGLMVHDMYLVEVKSPEESKRPWDYYKVLQTIPGEKVFGAFESSACPLVKK